MGFKPLTPAAVSFIIYAALQRCFAVLFFGSRQRKQLSDLFPLMKKGDPIYE